MNESAPSQSDDAVPGRHSHFLMAQGEMADRVRAHDWSSTPLGPIESWSETLLATVDSLLNSPFPFAVFWGAEFLLLYNDAYRPFLSIKHPDALGRTGRATWKEAWHVIGPPIEAAYANGDSTNLQNVFIPIEIEGQLQDRYWTYCFYPVYEQGHIVGVADIGFDSTPEVDINRKLRESEARSSRILESIGDAVIVTDAETRVTRMNTVAEALTGWRLEEARGHLLSEVFHIVNEQTRQESESPGDKVERVGAIVGLANHTVLIGRDGTETHIDDSGAPIRMDNGELVGVVLVFRGINERRAAERERDAFASRLRQVQDATTDSVVTIDRNWRITYMNPSARASLGPLADAIGKDVWESFPAAVYEGSPYVEHYTRAMNEGVAAQFEAFYPEPLNIWVQVQVRPTSDGIVLFFQDMTEQKRGREALRKTAEALSASEEELRWTVRLNAQIPWTADTEGRMLDISERWLSLTGFSREQTLGDLWLHLPPPEERPRLAEAWQHSLETGEPYDVEHHIQTAAGETCWMRSRAYPRRDEAGRIVKWYGTTEDIGARKHSETALRRSEESMRLALSAPNVLGTWDWDVPNDRITASEGFAKVFGVDAAHAAEGASLADYLRNIHPDDLEATEQGVMHALRTGGEFALQYRVLQTDGSVRWILAQAKCRLGPDGRPLRAPGVAIDITRSKQSEAALMQNEKLAAVGRLAASIAHEINNPLESVTNLLYLARTSEDSREIQEYLDIAERELRRVSAITNQTLQFYKQSTNPKPVTCEDLIKSVLSIYQGRIVNSHVDVLKRKRATRPVLCFEGEIRQVLNNIVGNAIDAMHPEGGRLLIRSRDATHWKTGRRGLMLTIADTGAGMSELVRSKLFEAFFTTKGIGGTGLGLWVSQQIVERHHGALRVRSSRRKGGSGSVFSLFLPYDAVSR